jgi:UDP-glucose 4-epimerase
VTGQSPLALTGGTGFVGQATLDEAARRSEAVRALARADREAQENVTWVKGDLANGPALALLCEGAGAVIHIAGAVNLPTRAEFAAVNIAGTQAVVDAARAAGVRRFVHVSSLAAREPGLSNYGWSKRMGEEVVQASGLDWTIIRPPAIYGPREREIRELFRAAHWRVLPMPPAGRASIMHVDDLARLLLDLVPAAASSQRIYEPDDGHANGWAHRELAQMIGAAVGRRVWAPHVPRGVLKAAARLDLMIRGAGAKLTPDRASYMSHPSWVSEPARAVPPDLWYPQIATPEGLRTTAQWYRSAGWL